MCKANYHTHTYRCNHAEGDVDDYVVEARKQGLVKVGFSEHMPTLDRDFNDPDLHMDRVDLPGYVAKVREASSRWDDIRVYLGGECDYIPGTSSFYKDVFLGYYAFEYLMLSTHFIKSDGSWVMFNKIRSAKEVAEYTDQSIAAMKTGLFDCMVHPDAFMLSYGTWDAQTQACSVAIIEAARDLGVILEMNTKGFRLAGVEKPEDFHKVLYPNQKFWELASQIHPLAIYGADAHKPHLVGNNINLCQQFAHNLDITLVDLFESKAALQALDT